MASNTAISLLNAGQTLSGDEYIPMTQPDEENARTLTTFYTTPSALATYMFDILLPPGTVMCYGGSTAPSGWLVCNGATLDTTTYRKLFLNIGYTYGGSGNSFKIPDLRGRVIVGQDQGASLTGENNIAPGRTFTVGQSGGEFLHALSSSELPAHSHQLICRLNAITTPNTTDGNYPVAMTSNVSNGSHYGSRWTTNNIFDGSGSGGREGFLNPNNQVNANQPHTNLQPYTVLNYIIRTGV